MSVPSADTNSGSDKYNALKRLHQLFSKNQWTFAKTMPQNPHEYTLRKKWEKDEEFVEAVTLIREHGYPHYFARRKYIQFNVLEHFYWTMGDRLDKTILINRAKIDKNEPHPYDSFSSDYVTWFTRECDLEEDRQVFNLVKPKIKGKVLDVGCGAGHQMLLKHIDPRDYTGIDPSYGMLTQFKQRFPGYTAHQSYYEDFPLEGFDLIISLFGSFSYISKDYAFRIFHQLNNGGCFFLMFIKDGYYPLTHTYAQKQIPYYNTRDYIEIFEGAKFDELSNYLIVSGCKDV